MGTMTSDDLGLMDLIVDSNNNYYHVHDLQRSKNDNILEKIHVKSIFKDMNIIPEVHSDKYLENITNECIKISEISNRKIFTTQELKTDGIEIVFE